MTDRITIPPGVQASITDLYDFMIRMQDTSHWRGHKIYKHHNGWRYCDNHILVESWPDRPCGHCGRPNTPKGHDGCIGELPGVQNACCGHGEIETAYIQYSDGNEVRGEEAILRMRPEL